MQNDFPVIDLPATGENIRQLREAQGLSVRDLQAYFGFAEPQAVYKWQAGKTLPSVDNLYALSVLLDTPMNDILIPKNYEGQAIACPSSYAEAIYVLFCFAGNGLIACLHRKCPSPQNSIHPYLALGIQLSCKHGVDKRLQYRQRFSENDLTLHIVSHWFHAAHDIQDANHSASGQESQEPDLL